MAERKPITGIITRIEGDVAVVAYEDSKNGKRCEIDVIKSMLPKENPQKGDLVTVDFDKMAAEVKNPIGTNMLEIEDAIEKALGLFKEEAIENVKTVKKVSAKRGKRA